MKTKFYYFILAALAVFTFSSCGGDDDDEDINGKDPNDGTEVTTNYTATFSIKTITMRPSTDFSYNTYLHLGGYKYKMYEDFNRLYSLYYQAGKLFLLTWCRTNGSWLCNQAYNYNGTTSYTNHLTRDWYREDDAIRMKDVGRVDGLSSITDKQLPTDGEYPQLQPYHGYAMSFTTEDGEQKFLRAYCTGVKQEEDGSLGEINLQYQLY